MNFKGRIFRAGRESEAALRMDHYVAGLTMTALYAVSRPNCHEYKVNVLCPDGEMPEKEKTRFTRFSEMAGLTVTFRYCKTEYDGYTTVTFVLRSE